MRLTAQLVEDRELGGADRGPPPGRRGRHVPVQAEPVRGADQLAAGRVEVTGDRLQGERSTDRLDARVRVLEARVHEDRAAGGRPDGVRELAQGGGRDTGDRLDAIGREALDVGGQLVEAVREALDEVVVVAPLCDQHVQHPERERPVGARANADPLGAQRPRRLGAAGVDHDDAAAAGLHLLQADEVLRRRCRGRVGTPDEHEVGVVEILGQVAVLLPEAGVRRDHPVGDEAERADARRVGRAEREQHGVRGRLGRPGRCERLVEAELEVAAARIDGERLGPVLGRDRPQPRDQKAVRIVP